jgi:hypothetical protein
MTNPIEDKVYDDIHHIETMIEPKIGKKFSFSPVWAYDAFYVNVWDEEQKKLVAEHLSSAGDCEDVWNWIEKQYPNIDWAE